MQFFTDPNQTGNMATNFKGAMKATLHRCVIRLDEVETFLAADVERNYDMNLLRQIGKGHIGDIQVYHPDSPGLIGVIYEGDLLFTQRKGARPSPENIRSFSQPFSLPELKDNSFPAMTMSFDPTRGKIRFFPAGSRVSRDWRDANVWTLYNLIRHYCQNEDRVFDDSDHSIPMLKEYVTRVNQLERAPMVDREVKDEYLNNLIHEFSPSSNTSWTNLHRWLSQTQNEHLVIRVNITDCFFIVELGLDARIISYYAMKERLKPTCLAKYL